jgi:hypothetical protein
MAEEETSQATEQQQSFLRRGEDFESLYANNVQFQPSEWDIKIVFGELETDTKSNTNFVEQHTGIALSWLQAKIMHYFLTLQLGVYELSHEKISVPPSLMPPVPDPPPDDPMAKKVFELISEEREKFFQKNSPIR